MYVYEINPFPSKIWEMEVIYLSVCLFILRSEEEIRIHHFKYFEKGKIFERVFVGS